MMEIMFRNGATDGYVTINLRTYKLKNISRHTMKRLIRVIKKYNWSWGETISSFERGYGYDFDDIHYFNVAERSDRGARERLYFYLTGGSIQIDPNTPCESCGLSTLQLDWDDGVLVCKHPKTGKEHLLCYWCRYEKLKKWEQRDA